MFTPFVLDDGDHVSPVWKREPEGAAYGDALFSFVQAGVRIMDVTLQTPHGAKPWRYARIPHDVIAENMTLHALVDQFAS